MVFGFSAPVQAEGLAKGLFMRGHKGITLIELLAVIVIVGVLAAVAIPAYTSYMQRARRADGKTALEQLRAAQEMFRAERGTYSLDLTQLSTTFGVPTVSGDYNVLLINTGAGAFLAEARPNTTRQSGDGSLFINQDGVKTPANKWAK